MVAAASKKEPNPFTENKRDAILKFYRPSDKDYAFVYARFYTVTRPSEAVALKWGRVDLLNGKPTIVLSRTLGEENAPETKEQRENHNIPAQRRG